MPAAGRYLFDKPTHAGADNHVDEDLLRSLAATNPPRQLSLWDVVLASQALSWEVSCCAGLLLADACLMTRGDTVTVYTVDLCVTASALLLWRFLTGQRAGFPTATALILAGLAFAMVTPTRSVGQAFHAESLANLARWLLALRLLSHDYGSGSGGGDERPAHVHVPGLPAPPPRKASAATGAAASAGASDADGEAAVHASSTGGRRPKRQQPEEKAAVPTSLPGGIISLNAGMFAAALLSSRLPAAATTGSTGGSSGSGIEASLALLVTAMLLFVVLPWVRTLFRQAAPRAFACTTAAASVAVCWAVSSEFGRSEAAVLAAAYAVMGLLGPLLFWHAQQHKVWPRGSWDTVEVASLSS